MTEFARPGQQPVQPDRERSSPRSAAQTLDSLERFGPAGNRAMSQWITDRTPGRSAADAPGAATADTFPPSAASAALARRGFLTGADPLFDMIGRIKAEQLESWRATAPTGDEESTPPVHVLAVVLEAMTENTHEVISDIVYGSGGTLKQLFVAAASRELGDTAAVQECTAGYEVAMASTFEPLLIGKQESMGQSVATARAVLSSAGSGSLLDTYVGAVRQQTAVQQRAEVWEFRARIDRGDDVHRLSRLFALEAIHQMLQARAQSLQRALTVGYLRLLDENKVWAATSKYRAPSPLAWLLEDMTFTRGIRPDLHASAEREGTLLALPAPSTSIGRWSGPNLGFGSFTAHGAGVRTKALAKLANTAVKDLPLTIGFRFQADNPYTRPILGRDAPADVWFSRDPNGNIYLDDDIGDGALEWLGSYYSGIGRELTAAERKQYAPLGAKKLYEATRNKPIASLRSSD
ncbi:MAG TPA: hypothetical protein VMU51_26770 [Mycobacteriales bacterium]|nr:hypothetical protein [Mycobacteriales bacterium]